MELLQLPIYSPSVSSVAGPSGRVYPVFGRLVAVLDEELVDFLRRDFQFYDEGSNNT